MAPRRGKERRIDVRPLEIPGRPERVTTPERREAPAPKRKEPVPA